MKRSFPANIHGKIFYIDEDAYELLNNYLSQLRATFPGEEGAEIVDDIESRICELFDERTNHGVTIIVLDDVNGIIEIMGRPEQLQPDGDDAPEGFANPGANPSTGPVPPPIPENIPVQKKLYRDMNNKVLGGVLSGFAHYFGISVTALRIAFVVLALFTQVIPCFVVYLILWLIIPPAETAKQILQMMGRPVTIDGVGQTVVNPSGRSESQSGIVKIINTILEVAGKVLLAIIGLIAGMGALSVLLLAIVIIGAIICASTLGSLEMLDTMGIDTTVRGWAYTMVLVSSAIPLIALVWGACTVLFKAPKAPTWLIVTAIILEIVLILATILVWQLSLHTTSFLMLFN